MPKKPSRKDTDFIPVGERPVVEIEDTDYQPSRDQLRADLRVDATFDEAIDALCKPVQVRQRKTRRS